MPLKPDEAQTDRDAKKHGLINCWHKETVGHGDKGRPDKFAGVKTELEQMKDSHIAKEAKIKKILDDYTNFPGYYAKKLMEKNEGMTLAEANARVEEDRLDFADKLQRLKDTNSLIAKEIALRESGKVTRRPRSK